ncbi:hypothetical protein AXE80_01080 [Wenyingzhuangia fucanilytica]|uniref:Glycosyl transferase family 1 domain-containing protein n=1 Tax=Wenyingzhuangia fucanilytica TaxID=1790137 RepID=A0A1B1Y2K2_9FLAO|nr:glycosyltransferase [Wenyingzhuangia fucanilytica]ANW94969.1 hypothetical protein AXE80_01080 [Wenyingzhuangia fucanilytica]
MIIIDMSAIKAGGGCQLALNYINELSTGKFIIQEKLVFLIPNIGPLSNSLDKKYSNLKFEIAHTDMFFRRFFFEKITLKRIYKKYNIDTIYTFFGAGLPHSNSIKSIVSVAYPIICYDESAFWKHIPVKLKIRQRIVNYLRIMRLKKADLIIAETDVMKKRLVKKIEFPNDNILVCPPSPSGFIKDVLSEYQIKEVPSFLILSGCSHHKNLWRLPELVEQLSKTISFKLIISVEEHDFIKLLTSVNLDCNLLAKYTEYKTFFEFKGTVMPNEIENLYSSCDFLLSLSDLESYSNNYMEAWKTGTPLIVSDYDFSREICRESAIYIDPHDVINTSKIIYKSIKEKELINKMILKGKEYLNELPTREERVNQINTLIS